jgi:hypothetical protein
MSDGSNSRSVRGWQSEFDRRAIHMAGHLLVAGIWLERRFVKPPKALNDLVDGPGSR